MAFKSEERRKEYHRDWYLKNKKNRQTQIYKHRRLTQNILRTRIAEYLSIHPCVDCGEQDIIVLDFDHVRGEKIDDISKMIRNAFSWIVIQKEIDKCEVVCSNDHRRRTAKRGNHFRHKYMPT